MTKEKITRSELKEKRTANRKVFENQDHSRTVESIWNQSIMKMRMEAGKKWMTH